VFESPLINLSFIVAKDVPKNRIRDCIKLNLLSRYKQGRGISSHCLRKKSPLFLLAVQICSSCNLIKSLSLSLMHLENARSI
jgi:hypothetical protein